MTRYCFERLSLYSEVRACTAELVDQFCDDLVAGVEGTTVTVDYFLHFCVYARQQTFVIEYTATMIVISPEMQSQKVILAELLCCKFGKQNLFLSFVLFFIEVRLSLINISFEICQTVVRTFLANQGPNNIAGRKFFDMFRHIRSYIYYYLMTIILIQIKGRASLSDGSALRTNPGCCRKMRRLLNISAAQITKIPTPSSTQS